MLARLGRSLAAYHHRAISVPRVERLAGVLEEQIGAARSLLDVGSGDGLLAATTARAVGAEEVRGVDVKLQPAPAVETVWYDGQKLPFPDRRFEIVLLSDVLHHAAAPTPLLAECLRVARRAVALKDHLCFGPLSRAVLLAMDRAGNAATGVTVRGAYLTLPQWIRCITAAGGRLADLRWPVRIHDLPWRLVTRSEYQFTALITPCHDAAGGSGPGDLPGEEP